MTSMMEDVRLSFLNVKNLKANLAYASHLARESDILYLSELWCKQNEINIVKSLSTKEKSKNILLSLTWTIIIPGGDHLVVKLGF